MTLDKNHFVDNNDNRGIILGQQLYKGIRFNTGFASLTHTLDTTTDVWSFDLHEAVSRTVLLEMTGIFRCGKKKTKREE